MLFVSGASRISLYFVLDASTFGLYSHVVHSLAALFPNMYCLCVPHLHLRSESIGPGDTVTIVLPNRVDYFVPVLAAWRCGAVVSVVDPLQHPGQLRRSLGVKAGAAGGRRLRSGSSTASRSAPLLPGPGETLPPFPPKNPILGLNIPLSIFKLNWFKKRVFAFIFQLKSCNANKKISQILKLPAEFMDILIIS